MKIGVRLVAAWLLLSVAYAQPPTPIAFPTAAGFGCHATGGRGGQVIVVSNLNDDGEGSLRHAVEQKAARIVVFKISGTIRLISPLNIKGDVTIAGQTAPGDGLCVADQPVKIDGNNVIIRYMRFRMGDKYQQQAGKTPGSGHDDVLGASRKKNIIIDHCSISWSTDEVCSVYGGDSTTIQHCIIAEPLNYSYHFEEGDTDFEQHGYGGIWGGAHLSAFGNLFMHCVSRMPRFNGTRLGATTEFVDFRNNVIYNWKHNNIYGGEGGSYNIVGNYYKAGPATNDKVKRRIVNPTKDSKVGFGRFYVNSNTVEGFPEVSLNNRLGIDMGNDATSAETESTIMQEAFMSYAYQTLSPLVAYKQVIEKAGASLCRDEMDKRLAKELASGTGKIIDVQGGYPAKTAFDKTLSAWPILKSGKILADQDKDGMPDEWENKQGLDPKNAHDAVSFSLNKMYTNIEVYINSLVD